VASGATQHPQHFPGKGAPEEGGAASSKSVRGKELRERAAELEAGEEVALWREALAEARAASPAPPGAAGGCGDTDAVLSRAITIVERRCVQSAALSPLATLSLTHSRPLPLPPPRVCLQAPRSPPKAFARRGGHDAHGCGRRR
jgi:hypothetical protein